MKGVILAGGKGTRLYPCTIVVNKHLLPIYDQPMIYYPIQTLVKAGCTEIMIVTGGENPGDFLRLLKNGQDFGLQSLVYGYQDNPIGGIADALNIAKSFVGQDKFCMILGDNLISDDLSSYLKNYQQQPLGTACIFLKTVENPTNFGVAEITNGQIINLIEKPVNPPSNLAVIGVYFYDSTVFDVIKNLKPSKRGELEITDVNLAYLQKQKLNYFTLPSEWLDTGSFDTLLEASKLIARIKNK